MSQNTLSRRNQLSSSVSTSSLPSAPRGVDSNSSIEQLTGKGQLFHGLGQFRQYCSQDSVQVNECSASDLKQPSDEEDDSFEEDDMGISDMAIDDNAIEGDGLRIHDEGTGENRELFYLQMTVKELIATERVYVKDLHDIVFVSIQFEQIM